MRQLTRRRYSKRCERAEVLEVGELEEMVSGGAVGRKPREGSEGAGRARASELLKVMIRFIFS